MPKKVFHVFIFLFFFSAVPSLVHAENQTVFGPRIFEIGRWHVLLSVHTFNVEDPGEGVITITKNTPEEQIRGGFVFFNTTFVPLRNFLVGGQLVFEKHITLQSTNFITVFLRGTPGASVTIEVNTKDTTVPPPEVVFSADPQTITLGEPSTLEWAVTDADSISIDPGIGSVDPNGSFEVFPTETTTYTLTATGSGGTTTESVTVTVNIPLPTVSISANPETIQLGESSTLTWISTNADTCKIDQGLGSVNVNGSMSVSPTQTTTYTITATSPGGTATAYVTIAVDDTSPPQVSINADPSSITPGQSSTLTWNSTNAQNAHIDNGIGAVSVDGSTSVSPTATTTYTITVTGPTGSANAQAVVMVTGNPELQPEGSFGKQYEDLIPSDATVDEYDTKRFSLITGIVHSIDASPISDVSVTMHGHPEYGTAFTDSDGRFSIPMEGGATMTIAYHKDGFITAHRKVYVPWNDIAIAETIQMIAEDPLSTTITFDGSPDTVVTHQSTEVTDEFGSRSCSMVFTGDNHAYLVDENGNDIHELTTITTRATEYTTPESMPAVLPPTSAYTYCAELSVDGAQRIRFEKPVIIWVDNFLGFDIGGIVPVGYYDRDRGVWVPSDNGIVVKLLDTDTDGIVDALDADGDDQPDDLNEDESFSDEVIGLDDDQSYSPGSTFWRVAVTHFTPFDLNWPPGYSTPPNPKDGPSSGEADPPCFVEGTLVKTNNGFEPIEKITKGDYVLSRDKSTTDAVLRKVARTFVTPNKSIVELKFYNANGSVETIGATAEHPFWSKDRGWVAAGNLRIDDKVYSLDSKWITFIGREPLPAKRSVYNIEVEELHTYFVGKSGLWVHNTCKTKIEPRKRTINKGIVLPGTGMTLNYVSNRVDGYHYEITVPASGETVPSSLKSIIVKVEVAGRTLEQTLDPQPNQIAEFHWDGLDYLGRPSVSRTAHVKIGFIYPSYYKNPAEIFPAFAIAGTDITFITARQEIVSWRDSNISVDPMIKTRGGGLIADGWSFSPHHYLSSIDLSILLKGDGTKIKNNAWIINTVAGTGEKGFSGDGGSATKAQLDSPWDVAMDAEGNIYIADQGNNRIRKVDTSGVINTVAGTGERGFSGDGGLATEAQLDSPWDVAMDAEGNIYIADQGNNRIRKVDTSGVINTVAGTGEWGFSGDGGLATEAQLNSPTGVAVDAEGNIYITDYGNNRIRKVDTSGVINTVAGTGEWGFNGDGGLATEAQFNRLYRVAVDAEGNIYITDYGNNRIRKVDTSGVINTVAGSGERGFSGDGGPATEAQIDSPKGVSVDASGNIYIADQGNNRIRKVYSSGIITTVAGSGEGGSGDGSPATEALLYYPWNVTVDAEGNIYIADTSDNRIRKVSTAETFAGVMTGDNIPFAEEYGVAHIMDGAGLHQKTVDLDTGVVLFEFGYDENNNLISTTDQFSNTITIQRDGSGIPTAIVSPDGITTGLTIGADNHLTRITYPDGSHYDFEYTFDGLMTAKIEPEGNRFEHVFDTNGRLTNTTDEEGGSWQFTRTAYENGDILTEALTGEGNLTSYLDHTYSTGAFNSTITGPTGAQTLFARSDDGLTVNKTLPCGMSFEFTYDVNRKYGFKYVRGIIESTPSSLERLTQRDKAYQDTNSDDVTDLITETVTVNGKSTTLENNVLQSQKTVTSPKGRTVIMLYDPNTLVTESVSVPGLFDTSYGYDTKGRLTSIATNTRGTDFAYNSQGFLESITDPGGDTTTYTYDAIGRTTGISRPDGSSIDFTYDKNGNMTVLTNPSTIDHSFGFNKVNLNSSYQTPLSGSYSYVYDKDRRLKQTNFPSGNQINNVYVNSRLDQIQTPEGNIDFTYICSTKVESITKDTESITYGYNGKLVTSETMAGTLSQSLGYTYNNDFYPASFTYASMTESYTYEDDGLLIGAGSFTISRNAQNGLPEAVIGGALNLNRYFNGYGEVEGQGFTVNSQGLISWNLIRDDNGRITNKSETVGGTTSDYIYTYDSVGRLRTVTKDSTLIEEYDYDANGTRINEMNQLRGITGRSFSYDNEDHMLTAGSVVYSYNPDGFLTAKTDGSDVTTYEYSSRGELLSVTFPGVTMVEYVHDPLGRRIAKKVNGSIVEKYLWQGLTRLLAVYDGSDSLLMRFEYADGRMPVAMTKGGSTYYLTYDQVGSLRVIADASGNVVKKIEYDSFGNIIDDTDPAFEVPFGFAGGLHDKDTGLVRLGYRDYDPDVGRWTSKDPILFFGGDTDLYGYCLSDPVNLIDPLGLRLSSGERAAVATASAVAGFIGATLGTPAAGAAAGGFTGFALSIALGGDAIDVVNNTTSGAISGAAGGLFGQLVKAAGAKAAGHGIFSFGIDLLLYGGDPSIKRENTSPCN